MSERRNELIGAAFLAAVFLVCCTDSKAADIVEAPGEEGTLILTDEAGHCVGIAKLAKWVGKGGAPVIPGCWRGVEGGVQVAFSDADAARYPLHVFRKVETL